MPRQKVEFPNADGTPLAGLLELPQGQPAAFALFAHCFTCGKDVVAASRIARALAARGIAVLRFDFTGLGNSDGDFANTSFSSNVDDLLAAAHWLEARHAAPQLLIGHSLGGAAVLRAAHELPRVKALCTIGAPATAGHVRHLLTDAEDELRARGEGRVRLGGPPAGAAHGAEGVDGAVAQPGHRVRRLRPPHQTGGGITQRGAAGECHGHQAEKQDRQVGTHIKNNVVFVFVETLGSEHL